MNRKLINEELNRVKSLMGLVSEVVDISDDSYISMNIKNFPKYKKEISDLLQNKLKSSNGDFVKFKNSVVIGYDQNKTPILSNDLRVDNRFLNFMLTMGSKKFNSLLYSIFSDYFGLEQQTKNTRSDVAKCDPSNFSIVGPLVAKDNKMLLSYWIGQEGGKVYKIRFPKECESELSLGDRGTYFTVEPNENRTHFPKGIPESLRGKKLGTLIYLAMIKKLGYVTSSMGNSAEIRMVWQDILTNPKYENDLMSLVLQKQILVFDRNTNEDIKKVFNEFVSDKFTDKKSVRISPALKEILGNNFNDWYDSLEETPEKTIDDKIKKYEGELPKGGDTVVDTKTGKIYSFNGEWEDKGKKLIQLSSDKFETLLLSADEKPRFKVIHRGT
jgi:hypothetical protein